MSQKKYNILVTGIGGNVGQGIVRNLLQAGIPLNVIGCNVTAVSAGNHLCQQVFTVPYAYDNGYIPAIKEICHQINIDLIIPSTDYEVFYLAKNRDILPLVAAMPAESAQIFLDKYLTWQVLSAAQVPFAKSYLPSEYSGGLEEIIVKPREGRGSRGIQINPANPGSFDDTYMVQQLHRGKEITSAFYVNQKGYLHGHLTMERSLEAGATTFCEVSTQYDSRVEVLLKQLLAAVKITGSANVQSIVTTSGDIIPFEINARISGTNSIRTHFGFKDVLYTLQELLLKQEPEEIKIQQGAAVRILMDVIYPGISLAEIKNSHTQHYLN